MEQLNKTQEDILFFDDTDKPHDECGIIGIYDPSGDNISQEIYFGLMALQHRGQESCGIAVNSNREIVFHKDVGLVSDVFSEKIISGLKGTMAVGHCRYSTYGEGGRINAQPLVLNYIKGNLAVAHNGNILNSQELKKEYEQTGAIYQTTADSEIIAYTIARERVPAGSIERAIVNSMKRLKGAYSLIVMSPQKLIAARDPWGFRPLCMGKKKNGAIVFASESCALDAVEATFIRDILPGEVVTVFKNEITTLREVYFDNSHLCVFEHIYFARPDSTIEGQFVQEARRMAGRFLAMQSPVEADIVIGVPDSGLGAAKGYSLESGIPLEEVFIKNKYIARTFIKPSQASREQAVKVKLNPLKPYVEGKRVVMVDDSIVRGTTCGHIVSLLRDVGAKEVHVRISSPPFINPCYYGTDIPSADELVANKYSLKETCKLINADSLDYLSIDNLFKIAPNSKLGFCSACFTGNYPVKADMN